MAFSEAAALQHVRVYCGWHVTPVLENEEITLDGEGLSLRLPTFKVVDLISVVEDGVELDRESIVESAKAPGFLYKRSGACWSRGFSNITVTLSHGFAEVPAFDAVVQSFVERMSRQVDGAVPVQVGPFRWSEDQVVNGSAFSVAEKAILDLYRLERAP